MKIFIRDSNKDLIESELQKVGGKLSHTLCYDDLISSCADYESYLISHLLPKSLHAGALLWLVGNGKKCNAYKYSYEAVGVMIERFSSGWALTSVRRVKCFPNQSQIVVMSLKSEQLKKITDNTRALFKERPSELDKGV